LLLLLLLPDLKKVIGYPADQASQLLQVWKVCIAAAPPVNFTVHTYEAYPAAQHTAHMLRCVCGQPRYHLLPMTL
jgi:hypothetical protein